MGRLVHWAQAFALGLGGPGLFVIAFLDSSFLTLPEINDLLLVWMVTQHKSRLVLYAVSATLGSIIGCLLLYALGRKGGDALVRRRFAGPTVDRALGSIQRYGLMAVLIPSLLPPPAPLKLFILLAGIAGISLSRFLVAIAVGRGIRYFGLGLLAFRYGDQATVFLHEHAVLASGVLIGLLVAGFAAYLLWNRTTRHA